MAIEEDEIRNLLDMPQDYENRNVNGWGVLYFDNLHPFYGGYGHIRGEIGDTRGGRVFVGDQGYVGLTMSIPLLGRDREPELDTYAMIYPEIPTNYLANAYIEGDEQSNRWRYDFGPGGPFNRNPVIEVLAPLRIDPDDPNTATGELHFEVAVEAVAYPWESVDVDFGNTLSLVDFGLNGSVGALTTPDSFFRNYAFEFPDTRGVPEPSFGFCFAAGLLAILRSRGVRRTGSLSRKKS
jgi:hypothetical protein